MITACSAPEQGPAVQPQARLSSDVALSLQPSDGMPKAEAPQEEPPVGEPGSPVDGRGGGGAPAAAVAPEQPKVEAPAPVETPTATLPPTDVPAAAPALDNLPVGPSVGYRAPDFSLQTPDGQTVRLSELRGRPVVISYWASWCVPCLNEMQILQKVYADYRDQGFVVLSVNAIEQDSLDKIQGVAAEYAITFPIVLDHGDQFAGSYNALFFPTTYFVDASGVIRDIALGDSPEAEFRARVERFLAGDW